MCSHDGTKAFAEFGFVNHVCSSPSSTIAKLQSPFTELWGTSPRNPLVMPTYDAFDCVSVSR